MAADAHWEEAVRYWHALQRAKKAARAWKGAAKLWRAKSGNRLLWQSTYRALPEQEGQGACGFALGAGIEVGALERMLDSIAAVPAVADSFDPRAEECVADGVEGAVETLAAERDAALARAERLEKALVAVWRYEERAQADLKARGEVSDGTMHLLLSALDLRAAALREGKP